MSLNNTFAFSGSINLNSTIEQPKRGLAGDSKHDPELLLSRPQPRAVLSADGSPMKRQRASRNNLYNTNPSQNNTLKTALRDSPTSYGGDPQKGYEDGAIEEAVEDPASTKTHLTNSNQNYNLHLKP